MSLQFTSVTTGPVACAAQTPSFIAVGLSTGSLRVFSPEDFALEREVSLGKTVSRIAHIPGTELVAVISDQKCSIHDLKTRKVIADVDSSSARYLAVTHPPANHRTRESILVVASSYKLRVLRFVKSQLTSTTVIDSPQGLKIRALGNEQQMSAYVVLGNRSPVLWHFNIASGLLRPIVALDLEIFRRNAHKFSITGTQDSLLLTSSTGAQLLRLKPLQLIKSWKNWEILGATILNSSPLGIDLFVMLMKRQSKTAQPMLCLGNLNTGSVLAKPEPPLLPLGDKSDFGKKVDSDQLVRMSAELTVENISALENPREAASLAFRLPSEYIDKNLRDLERQEATRIFGLGELDESMRLFLLIEEQEGNEELENHKYVVHLIDPLLNEMAEEQRAIDSGIADQADGPALSSQQSVFSMRTSISSSRTQSHALDSVVAYLNFTRRKLRLLQNTNGGGATTNSNNNDNDTTEAEKSSTAVDTALFRCYMIMKSPLVAPLLRSANYCDPNVVKETLLAAGKWRELVWFLRSRNDLSCHRQALDLLAERDKSPDSIVSYLESIRGATMRASSSSSSMSTARKEEAKSLILEYARPAISEKAELARRLFYDEYDIDSDEIYQFLNSIDEKTGQDFVLYRVLEFGDQTPALHNETARILSRDPKDENRLANFLRYSKFLVPGDLVKETSFSPRSIAILQERLGNSKSAIDIYLNEVKDLQAAQELAERQALATYLFDKILRLSEQAPNDQKDWLSKCLNTSSTKTDLKLSHVLSKLPDSTPLASINAFMKSFIVSESMSSRNAETSEALDRTALSEYSIELADIRRYNWTVDSLNACHVCHKSLGKSVTGVVDGHLVHFGCLQ